MSYPLQFLFIVMLVAFACSKVTLQGDVCRKYLHGTRDSVFYNALFFTSVLLFLVIIFHPVLYTRETFIFGVLVGAASVIFQCTYSIALTIGPVSLTVMITGFSIMISTISSVILFNESVSVFQVIGMIFLAVSLVLTTFEKKSVSQTSLKWLINTLVATVSNGAGATLQKVYSKLYAVTEKGDTSASLLVIIYLAAAVLSFCALVFFKKPEGRRFDIKHAMPFALGIGLIICVYQRLYMIGLSKIDGVFFFPVSSGLQSLAMTFIGVTLFRDKLSRRQWAGTACGLLSICLMNIR